MAICEPAQPKFGNRGHLTVELTTSALCDLDCTYCFEGAKTNPKRLSDLESLIARIYELLDSEWFKTKYDGMSLSFWGGEPTLNVNYIIKIMNEFQNNDAVTFHIYSNGFNRKNWQKLVDAVKLDKLDVQISYDGRVINDLFRLTNNGKSTADMVLENFDWMTGLGFRNLWFKSTLPSHAIPNIYATWLDFESLHEKYKNYGNNVRISFAPTLDYTMTPNPEDKSKRLSVFREQMLKVAKKEIEFFKKNGRHLCTWFAGGDTKVTCSAGLNMLAVDVDGGAYACHGALYSEGKDKMKSATIFDVDFLEKVQKFNDSFEPIVTAKNPICEKCVATTCMICPVASYELSKEEDFFSKWSDKQINGLCEFYQTFGEIDRSVQHYLRSTQEN